MGDAEVTAQAVELLRRVEARLRQGWTQGAWARDARSRRLGASSSRARCWCIAGAVWAERDERPPLVSARALCALRGVCGVDLLGWNDAPGRTQAEVLDAVAQAIDLLARGEVV